MTHTLLLDTSSLTYRAFFALPSSITDPDGRPINAVHGYLDMVSRLLQDHRPDEMVHVFDDDWRPAARVEAYAGYKSQRPEDPEDLPWQFELLRAVLDGLGEQVCIAPEWEADDAIGVLSTRAGGDDRVDIVTGDRDLIQLVRDPVVRVLFTRRGVSELDVYDEGGVLAAYGVPASRYVDFATLRGDPSDGLPGVKGVGEKTARSLVQRYPDLGALVADADSQTPRLAESLRGCADYVAAMRAVVPVRTDVEIEVRRSERDEEELDRLGAAHRLDGVLGRFRAGRDGTAPRDGTVPRDGSTLSDGATSSDMSPGGGTG